MLKYLTDDGLLRSEHAMGITTTSAKSLYEEVNGYNVKIKKLNSVT
jgi:hypothetical protein